MKKLNLLAVVLAAVSLLFAGCQNDTSDDDNFTYSALSFINKVEGNGLTVLDWTEVQRISGVQAKDQLPFFVIPENFKSIADRTFSGCISLIVVVIPSSIESIGAEAFCGCELLLVAVIPYSVNLIDSNAFKGCNPLIAIDFEDTESKWVEEEKTPGGFSTVRTGISARDVADALKSEVTSKHRFRKLAD